MDYDEINEIISAKRDRPLTDRERKQAFNAIVQSMTGDRRGSDLPPISTLKEWIADVYPGDRHAALRDSLFDKLKKLAVANQEGADRIALRQRGGELFTQTEAKLADDDRLLPVQPESEIDTGAVAEQAIAQQRLMNGGRITP